MRSIAFHKAHINREEEQAVLKTLRSGWLTTGPQTQCFEKLFADAIDVPYAIGLNSCTAGLFLALKAFGIGRGDEVIVSPLTFAASANVIIHVGATVRFADVDSSTGNITLDAIKKTYTKKTRAVIVVHLAGYPCAMNEIMRFCRDKNVFVIEDAAHGLGASYRGKAVGAWGDAASFSFYATKNITTIEGGMLVTRRKRIAERIRLLRLHGLSQGAWKRYAPTGSPSYDVLEAGYKYNMSDVQAALGIVQLKKFKKFQKERTRLWRLYMRELSACPAIILPKDPCNGEHAHHLFIIKLDDKQVRISRDDLMGQLRKKGIYTQVHFKSLHMQPYYKKKYCIRKEEFPVAARLSDTMISLPLYPGLADKDLMYIVRTLSHEVQKAMK